MFHTEGYLFDAAVRHEVTVVRPASGTPSGVRPPHPSAGHAAPDLGEDTVRVVLTQLPLLT
ncbi:hypothetical protein HTV80_13680 [Streptomyces sp. Vc74B-19]|uniref:hypothetical protein n=1 Tax=unclassified Streptomyces TaxID=2593676 RepID=UPI001BFC467F|nr:MULTISPECIES: hypothetical protein [unclassified Streptomyces]MBT3164158.1 hypothetical protein [Streptomyces sp. Vc74B-19]MCO4697843.1 hypothetical protein [Streptomyces sp. RO-S4]MDU0305471.1 hypothetical protein [Streptomyces sp. PAL114]